MEWDTTQLRDLATTTLSLSRSGAREIIRTSKPPQHKNYFPKRPASLRLRQKTTCASRTRLRDRSFREQIPLAASNCDTSNTHTALGRRMSLPSALRPSVLGETNRDPSASARFTDTLHDCVTGHNYLCRQKRRDERVEHGPGACGGGKLNIYWTRRRKKQHHNLKRTKTSRGIQLQECGPHASPFSLPGPGVHVEQFPADTIRNKFQGLASTYATVNASQIRS
jgi:hypothetical protein